MELTHVLSVLLGLSLGVLVILLLFVRGKGIRLGILSGTLSSLQYDCPGQTVNGVVSGSPSLPAYVFVCVNTTGVMPGDPVGNTTCVKATISGGSFIMLPLCIIGPVLPLHARRFFDPGVESIPLHFVGCALSQPPLLNLIEPSTERSVSAR